MTLNFCAITYKMMAERTPIRLKVITAYIITVFTFLGVKLVKGLFCSG